MNVLVIDMIEGFTRIGAMANPRVKALLLPMVAFLESLPEGSHVIFAYDAHGPDDAEFKRFPVHALAGTEESKVCQELIDACSHATTIHFVPKTTHSAFYETDAAEIIKEETTGDDWILVGCLTDMCIPACIFPMVYRGLNITLLRDLIDAYDAPGHNADEINTMFFNQIFPHLGCKVTTSEELINELSKVTN